ncbi:Hydroxypyruvate reductase [Lonepinella sp. MS14434]|uniref:phosphoglycerate dehydrogenase n=1 Tax=Lonepinella sp. MS14434 TaxID=3003617 RepID=UPI0036DBB06F
MKNKILVNTEQFKNGDPIFQPLVDAGFEVIVNETKRLPTEEKLIQLLDDNVVATIAGGEPYTENVLKKAKNLRIIARWGVGYDHVDVNAATQNNIVLAMAFGGNHESVAEYAIALALSLACELPKHDQILKRGDWGFTDFHPGLWGKNAGIIGFGRIGQAMAERCLGLKMKVQVYDPFARAEDLAKFNLESISLDDLLANSDLVSVHAPSTPDTRHLLSEVEFKKMKNTAILINTSRGPLIDEKALVTALENKEILGAGLDVFEQEPLDSLSKLRKMDNVILSSHVSGMDLNARQFVTERCIKNILNYLNHDYKALEPYVINKELIGE